MDEKLRQHAEELRVCCSIAYMVGTEEESFEWLDISKHPEEIRILQETVNVLDLPRPGEVRLGTPSLDSTIESLGKLADFARS